MFLKVLCGTQQDNTRQSTAASSSRGRLGKTAIHNSILITMGPYLKIPRLTQENKQLQLSTRCEAAITYIWTFSKDNHYSCSPCQIDSPNATIRTHVYRMQLKKQILKILIVLQAISLKCGTIIISLVMKRVRKIKLELDSTESCMTPAAFLWIVLLFYRTQCSVNVFISKFIFTLGVYFLNNSFQQQSKDYIYV